MQTHTDTKRRSNASADAARYATELHAPRRRKRRRCWVMRGVGVALYVGRGDGSGKRRLHCRSDAKRTEAITKVLSSRFFPERHFRFSHRHHWRARSFPRRCPSRPRDALAALRFSIAVRLPWQKRCVEITNYKRIYRNSLYYNADLRKVHTPRTTVGTVIKTSI